MAHHQWTEFQFTPVSAELNERGDVAIYASEEGLEIARAESVYRCWYCGVELLSSTIGTGCIPLHDND